MCYIDCHTHKSINQAGFKAIVNFYPSASLGIENQMYASMGLHPWHIANDWKKKLIIVETFAKKPYVVAIGEAGLDKLIATDMAAQKEVFVAQAQLAAEVSKPMIIHAVKTFNEIIGVRKHFSNVPPWIIHGFRGKLETMQSLVKNDFLISCGPAVLKAYNRAMLREIPINKLFLETDDSEVPIQEVYNKVATIRGISVEELKAHISRNFATHFKVV